MANLSNNSYTSCIRINGVPILPPLITPEKQLEIQIYKLKAIEIEKRIKMRLEPKLTNTLDKTLEHSLAFDDSNALIDLDECDKTLPEQVPLIQTKSSKLSYTILDVTEYNDHGIILFNEKDQLIDTKSEACDEKIAETSVPQLHPRLLRSNSYILDAPSPVLLEHFKQHIESNRNLISKTISPTHSSSNSNLNTIDSIIPQNGLTTDSITSLIKELAPFHFGDQNEINSNKMSNSIDIEEFLKRHCNNAAEEEIIENCNSDHNEQDCFRSISNPINDESSSCTFNLSTGSVTENVDSTVQLIDFESEICENFTPCSNDIDYVQVFDLLCDAPQIVVEKRKSCARELFGDISVGQKRREEWAATVLTSAARGYLVRRLKRTERVKNLIQTISDTLLLAMSLHSEKSDTIQSSDVELHRRLIQQISAACYEFYEIFFNLTIKEQMEIISVDRQRLKEKSKRPGSASSLKLSSERSSRSQRNTFHTKQKKPLVTSLVA